MRFDNNHYKELRDFQEKPVCVYGQRYYRTFRTGRAKRVPVIFRFITQLFHYGKA